MTTQEQLDQWMEAVATHGLAWARAMVNTPLDGMDLPHEVTEAIIRVSDAMADLGDVLRNYALRPRDL